MKTLSLPVYLTPEQHAALKDAAARRGSSMTELVRHLIEEHLLGDAPPTDLTSLAGTASVGRPTDVANEKGAMLDEALRAVR
jgi:hypothetical protein